MRDLEARIVFERDGLVAVDKPPGLPSTGRRLDDPDCLQSMLIARAGRMVWAVHQLDTETSGLILFVTRKRLVDQTARRMRPPGGAKVYIAVCHGTPRRDRYRVDAPIGPIDAIRPMSGAARRLGVTPAGQPAQSRVRVLDRSAAFALVAVELLSGRTHQARIHLAHLGHPLVGERLYRLPPCTLHARHALHAARLRLGGEGAALVLEAPLPADLVDLLARLGLDPRRATLA